MLKRINPDFVLAFLVAFLFWAGVSGWLTSYAPTEPEKEACYQAAAKSGRSIECKTLWERTTSDPVALFTLFLVVSNVGLWGATIALYLGGNRQLQLARDEFLSTHRPRLKVRRIFVVGFHQRFPEAPFLPGNELNASLEIVNIGGSEATIIWSRYRIYLGKDDYSLVSHYVPPRALLGPITFEPGQHFAFELVDRVPENVAPSGTFIRPDFGKDDWRLYIIGEVRYRDRLGIIRHLGFCRRMDEDLRLRPVNDPDYEYED